MPKKDRADNVVEGELTVESTEPVPEPTETPEDYKAKYEETLESFKRVQRDLADREVKLTLAQKQAGDLESVLERVKAIEENQALTLDYVDGLRAGEIETPETEVQTPAPKPTRRLDLLKEQRAQEEHQRGELNQFITVVDALGLDINDANLQREVIAGTKSPIEALVKLPVYVKKTLEEKAEILAKVITSKAKEEERVKAEEEGLLDIDTGSPSASASGFRDIEGKFARGEITYGQYRKARLEEGIE